MLVIGDFDITKKFMSLFLTKQKRVSSWKRKNIYNLIVINKNVLYSKNRRVDKKTKSLIVKI